MLLLYVFLFYWLVKEMVSMLNWKHKRVLCPSQPLPQWEENDLSSSQLVQGT